MLTLQSTFQYGQQNESPPVEYAEVVLDCPQLSLAGNSSTSSSTNSTTTATPTLVITGHNTISFAQRLANDRYSCTIPTANVFGPNYGKALQAYLVGLLRNNNHLSLSDLSLDFQAHFSSSTDDPYLLQTLFFFQNLKTPPTVHSVVPVVTPSSSPPATVAAGSTSTINNIVPDGSVSSQPDHFSGVFPLLDPTLRAGNQFTHAASTSSLTTPEINLINSDNLNQVVDANIFLINKQAYQAMLKQLFPTIAPENESVLLYMISALVSLNETIPRLSTDSEAVKKKLIQNVLTSFNQSDPQGTIYTTLTQGFTKLFDIPIVMPVFKLLTLAGSLTFRNTSSAIPFEDLNFFHLSAEYYVSATERRPEPVVSHYVWDKKTYQNNIATFKYQDPVIQSRVQYPVRVRVKAYDQSDVYLAEFDPSDPRLQALSIVIDLRLPPALAPVSGTASSVDTNIRGKVVALTKECKLSGTVIIQAKKTANDPWHVVSSGTSDQAGNFNLPFPPGKFVSAQALVSLDPTHPTPVSVDSSTGSISSDFLYLLIQRDVSHSDTTDTPASDPDSADCTCGQGAAGRLPSQSDLIQSNQFTQDVGGCVSLTVPNRILREYSYRALIRESDPDVASYRLRAREDDEYNEQYDLITNRKISRGLVDFDNPIDWQDGDDTTTTNLTIYQAVTVSTGVILHYRSEFRADGYSLGDLIYSLPLAPGQKKQIVTIEAAHSLLGSEAQNLSQSDMLANNLLNERSIVDQIAGNIGESLQGQSSASTSGISAGLGAAGSAGFLGASLGVSGGYSNSNSSASQDGKRAVSQYFNEVLRQNILQNTSDYRSLSATAVTSVQEGQSYNAQTDVVANHNHCHSLTMLYFEVLRHFAVYQELSDAEECVFVPLLMTKFTRTNVGKWADILARRLLPLSANTWILPKTVDGKMQHSLIPAFDANERVRTNWSLVDFPTGPYDMEPIIDIQGTMTLKVSLPRPKTHYDFVLSFPLTLQTQQVQVTDMKSLADSARDFALSGGWSFLFGDQGSETRDVQVLQRAKVLDNFISIDDNFQTVPPAQCLRVTKFDPFTVDNKTYDPMKLAYLSPIDSAMWASYAHLLGFVDSTKSATQQLMEYYFQGQLLSDWNTIWNNTIAPEIYKNMLTDIAFDFATFQITTLDNYNGGQRIMTAYLNGTANNKTRKGIGSIRVASHEAIFNTSAGPPSGSLVDLRNSPVIFDALSMRLTYSTEHYHGTLFSGTLNTDILTATPQPIPTLERAEEKRDPRKDDVYLANRLLQHLNSNLEYYNRVLWSGLDSERRYMLLDGFKIETFDKYGASEGFRSLASVLKNELVSIVGNSLVFPVAPGYKVSQALVVSHDARESSQALLDFYRPEITPAPYRISVPTRGVYAEALMGACDSCEPVKADSSQDWTKFTTDEPTSINPVTAPVPTVSQYNPNFKDFAQPLVQIQNAPAAPDPGAGLAAVTALLGKSDIFKDVTGLDQNQKNAIEAFSKTQDNAKAFAQMASSMVTQAHNTDKSGQIMSSINSAQKSGNLTKEEAGKLVKDHLQQQIDGGATLKSQLDQSKNAGKPSLTDAAVSAAGKQGTAVKATKTSDSDGTVSESVDINPSTGASGSRSSQVQGLVPKVQQKTDKVCWAAAATMMLSWLEKRSMTQEEAMSHAGPMYLDKFKANSDLKASEKDAFLGVLGMVSEPPASYKVETYMQWMDQYGPLWVTIDAAEDASFSPHAKILIQIDSDDVKTGTNTTFTLLDPATPGDAPEKVKFEDFEKAFEQIATDNRSSSVFKQVVHFANDISKGEGFMIQGRWPHQQSPVHETMTLAALMASDFALDKTTTLGTRPDINEFSRGNIWPDDPQNLLFNENPTNNWDKALGLEWGIIYELNVAEALLNRSHKGDLQFLHSMSSAVGESPQDTLAKLKLWSEVLYKLSTGVIDSSDRLTDISISTQSPSKTYDMSTVFGGNIGGIPVKAAYSLTTLLASDTKYVKLDMRRRALGALLHTIQDSYSHSHCRRTLLNPQDVTNLTTAVTPLDWQFKQGTHAKFGPVENFHTYTGQDDKRHGLYDMWPPQSMKASDPSTFDGLLGGRDAIEKCVKLVNFWNQKADWANGPSQLINGEIWALANNVTAADNTVD